MSFAVHLIARGRVQGVWFRAGTQKHALQLGVCGWAKNCPDGSVEMHAEGEKDALDRFIIWCGNGPPTAKVSALDIKRVAPQGLNTFEIRY
ncbi:MAG: acylphosphatase [Nitrospinaceae bacterium]